MKYLVKLSPEQRGELEALTRRGRIRARKLKRALILLAADDGDKDEDVAKKARVSRRTVARVRQRFAVETMGQALNERSRPGKARLLDGRQEAYVIALACSDPPEGHAAWTLRLLSERLVELEVVEKISHHTVWRVLKRGKSNPTYASSGASPR